MGYGPLTEPEAIAVYNFTLQHNFRLVLAYHTQGEVIYWQFQNYNPPGSFAIGTQFLVITHRKGTMEAANTVYGITMEEKGISKLVSMKLDN